jgi:acyl-CoA thioesterase FadM
LRHRDLVDIELTVAAVGRTSVTYDVEVRRGAEPCARGRAVAVLMDRVGGSPVRWPDEYRRLLQSGGPQRPELFTEEPVRRPDPAH